MSRREGAKILSSRSAELGKGFQKVRLEQNYPNPFNPTTTIGFSVRSSGFVSLKVYDVLGREVKVLVNEFKKAGRYEVKLDASGLPSGVYLYRLCTAGHAEARKLVILR